MANRRTAPNPAASINDIGGAICRRLLERGGEVWKRPGEHLTEDEVRAIPRANLVALRDNGFLQVYPKQVEQVAEIAPQLEPVITTRFAIHRGCGKYDVIEGIQLNTEQLTKEQALAMVAEAAPAQH